MTRPQNQSSPCRGSGWLSLVVVCLVVRGSFAAPLDYEEAPIHYSQATPETAISRLQTELESGQRQLISSGDQGYLRAVLQELEVPESSQMLTFLKSSMQRPLIEPQNPRALYFGDDAYVGYVPGGILELIVPDPRLGLVFYTMEAHNGQPMIQHQVARCMTCHASSRTKRIPGLQARSMFTDPTGQPVISAGSFRTDHSSPLEKRWGGWFVSGTHGETAHLGNMQLPDSKRPKQPVVNTHGLNVTDLSSLTDVSKHLTPHSDIVALLVFEHQIDAHNWMVRVNYAYQLGQHQPESESSPPNWQAEADALVKHLLFIDENPLKQPVQGTSDFASEFARRGPFDSQGRSLREFDLSTRIFKYPCSYTIHCQLFQALPAEARQYVLGQMQTALQTPADSPWSESLSRYTEAERTAALAMLAELTQP
ncbi:hypothetical protein DTL42_25780 [Bremerella cremea]|uniref:Cytochrome c domain-containing protein n=1 Tax=Bremerella cremea TaxID=1031537 RepID=A0A368KN69_9BACT|nr:hypothetical protein [Bremerella cremea]RCS40775.1 hypothetical protein DTL42_25780 [Bremerella cremea]